MYIVTFWRWCGEDNESPILQIMFGVKSTFEIIFVLFQSYIFVNMHMSITNLEICFGVMAKSECLKLLFPKPEYLKLLFPKPEYLKLLFCKVWISVDS